MAVMSAELLREAAALMRERAVAATDVAGASDWFVVLRGERFAGEYGIRSSGGLVAGETVEEEAEHIASWHPTVAVAVADWLDEVHADLSTYNATTTRAKHAFAVANAYLGRQQ
jgi:hypothetical protein